MRALTCLLLLLGLTGPTLAAASLPTVRLLVSNPTPYLGEELVLTLEIRTEPSSRARLTPLWPELDAFSAADLPGTPPRREGEGGTAALVQTVAKVLRPLRSGPLTLAGGGVRVAATLIPAAPARLQVRPLPTGAQPADFAGAMGAVSMTLEAQGSGTREIVLSLRGAAPLADFPHPLPHLGATERLLFLNEEVSGAAPGERQRRLHYLYLPGPGRRGELGFTLALFDPLSGRYQTLTAGGPASGTSGWLWLGLGLTALLAAGAWRRLRRRPPTDLTAVLQQLLGRPVAGLPRHCCLARLRARHIPQPLLAELGEHWRQTDRNRFAPPPPTEAEPTPAAERRLAARLWNAVDKSPRLP